MQFTTGLFTLVLAATGINAAPAVENRQILQYAGAMDFFSKGGCTGGVCNGLFPIPPNQCTPIPSSSGCDVSGNVTSLVGNCTAFLHTDFACTSLNVVTVTNKNGAFGQCMQPGAVIGSVYIAC